MAHRTVPNAVELDALAWRILEALQHNARQSFAQIGRQVGLSTRTGLYIENAQIHQVGLSTPAVAERVHRLEEAGVITGYHVALDLAKLGVPIRVLVRLTIPGGDLQVRRTVAAIKDMAEISRCHRITGAESFLIEANIVSIRHMEALIDKLSALGATSTSTVLSSPVQRREYSARQIEAFSKDILFRRSDRSFGECNAQPVRLILVKDPARTGPNRRLVFRQTPT